MLIHRVAGSDKGNYAARTHLIERLGEKIVMDGKTELVVSPVVDLILPKGDVAHGDVVKIPPVGGFKSRHGDVGLRVELLCDPARDAVQLHAVEFTVLHFLRQTAEKIADAASRFQDVAGLEAHAANRFIHSADHRGAGVVGVQGGGPRGGVFLRGQERLQLFVLIRPRGLAVVKSVGKAAPADVAGKDFLFLRRGVSSLGLNGLKGTDGLDVGMELGFRAASAQAIVGDAEVFGGGLLRRLWGRRFQNRRGAPFGFRLPAPCGERAQDGRDLGPGRTQLGAEFVLHLDIQAALLREEIRNGAVRHSHGLRVIGIGFRQRRRKVIIARAVCQHGRYHALLLRR